MDPLSITAGVLALLSATIKVGTSLKEFHGGVTIVEAKVQGLSHDVESFTKVLKNITETLDQENVQVSLQATGHIGNHYKDLHTSIEDGQNTLLNLQVTIDNANKTVRLLDGVRKHIRVQGAADEIVVHHLKIRSCRDTLQLSLQAITLWNQIETRETNDKIIANLDEVQRTIYTLATNFNIQIASLQRSVESKSRNEEIRTLTNSRKCVQSAATVVSSASTALGCENVEQTSPHGSEFGDLFQTEHNESTQRWISSNNVYEFDEEKSDGTLIGGKDEDHQGHDSQGSDSESELETEIIVSFADQGAIAYKKANYPEAERLFCRALVRIGKMPSGRHRNDSFKAGITYTLVDTYLKQEKLDEAQSLLMDTLAQAARGSKTNEQDFFTDMLALTRILYRKKEYEDAYLYGRKALKGCRKLGPPGYLIAGATLHTLILICRATGNIEQEEAYTLMHSNNSSKQLELEKADAVMVPTTSDSEVKHTSPSMRKSLPLAMAKSEDTGVRQHLDPRSHQVKAARVHLVSNMNTDGDASVDNETAPNYTTQEVKSKDDWVPSWGPIPTNGSEYEGCPPQYHVQSEVGAMISEKRQDSSLAISRRGKEPESFETVKKPSFFSLSRNVPSKTKRSLEGNWIGNNERDSWSLPLESYQTPPPPLDAAFPSPGYIQVMVMGAFGVGKSSLINAFGDQPLKRHYDHQPVHINKRLDGVTHNLELVEMSPGLVKMRYQAFKIVLMCFSLVDNLSLDVIPRLANDVKQHHADVPIVLVGLGEDRYINVLSNFTKSYRSKTAKAERGKGHEVQRGIGASQFLHCSAKTGDGINEVFRAAVSATPPSKRTSNKDWGEKIVDRLAERIYLSDFLTRVEEHSHKEKRKAAVILLPAEPTMM